MAEKKTSSRAQLAVTDVKRKNTASSTSNSKSTKKTSPSGQKAVPTAVPDDNRLPTRVILAAVSAGLFIFFLVIAIKPDGALLKVMQSVLFGLIGKVGFYFAIPALLYMFVILVSAKRSSLKMRCISLISFVLLCGCIFHLLVNNQTFIGGIKILGDLYTAGLKGFSVGGAGISTKHAGFAVNMGGATAADVKQLLVKVSDLVFENSGIRLEPEVRIW